MDEIYEGIAFELNGALLKIANAQPTIKLEVFTENVQSSKVSAMIDTNSVEKIKDICKANGYDFAVVIKDFPWGSREIVIRDPDGFVIVFRKMSYEI